MSGRCRYVCREAGMSSGRKAAILLFLALPVAAIRGRWARAQSSPTQSFDVISVKLNQSINSGTALRDSIPGHFGTTNLSLRDVIEFAYDVKGAQIEGLPGWADSEKYDIDAKVDDQAAEREKSLPWDQRLKLTRMRVQSMLADRFALQLHHETKDMPVLVLTVAKGGPKLTESAAVPRSGDAHPLPPGSLMMSMSGTQWTLTSNQAPLRILVNALSGQPEVSGRVLVDQTGLNGKYTFTLQWSPQNLSADGASPQPGPSLFTALEEQLGLRIQSTKAPVDVLVVDHVERPTPN